MRLRIEHSRADRAFNIACQLLAYAALGMQSQNKGTLRCQIRDRLRMPDLLAEDADRNKWWGDLKATGDAANLLGIRSWWQEDKFVIKLDQEMLQVCCNYLLKTPEAAGFDGKTDLFSNDRPFLVERSVNVRGVAYQMRITRLEDGGLIAGSLARSGNLTHFFAKKDGSELIKFGHPLLRETVKLALEDHQLNAVSFNPSSSPFDKTKAAYVSKLERDGHLRYPFIRSRQFPVKATVVNAELLSERDQADMWLIADQLTAWMTAWTSVHGFSEPETFAALIRRTFGK